MRTERKFLITGGTGFLGSYLFISLCEKGYPVTLLCRPKDNSCAEERVEKILKWFGRTYDDFPGLRVIEGRIENEMFGIRPEKYVELLKDTGEIIHCASDTDFAESNRTVIESVNIGFLKNMLNFAKESDCKHFHYLSTAYSAGRFEGECPEELSYPEMFTNVYEETKNRAEKEAFSYCTENGIKLTIYRPSIVYGESDTGRSRKFNAFYFPIKAISYIKDIMIKDVLERGGKRAAALGVSLKNNGALVIPIRLRTIYGGSLNLIPVDFFTKAVTALIENAENGGIYHLVNRDQVELEDVLTFTSEYFNVEGLRVYQENGEDSERTGMEELFESYIKMYLPYIGDKRIFLTERADEILKNQKISCPKMTYEIFKKCIDYAELTAWGKKFET
jgi:nucleoside-diphosphate-sugar epimerase